MKAIGYDPVRKALRLIERQEPSVASEDEIKMRVIRVGICGTDRRMITEAKTELPAGKNEIIIGHEMFGQVVEVGKEVKRVKTGDLAIFTVRRGCGRCIPCKMNRSDMCITGEYGERGIHRLDGYQTEFAVDKEQYAVSVPRELEQAGVLCEPLSIVEKSLDEVFKLQFSRLPDAPSTPDWFFGRRCLVTGLGPIGLLASLALAIRGATVYGLDIVDTDTARPRWLTGIGGQYVDGRKVVPDKIDDMLGGAMDLIFEASGVPGLAFNLPDVLGYGGIYVFAGVPAGGGTVKIPGAELMRQLVEKNQVLMGSVNASRGHFQMAINDLLVSRMKWGSHIEGLISHRHPYTDFEGVLTRHPPEEIKSVLEWSPENTR